MRWKVNKHKDKRYFRNTAVHTKDINVSARPMRGGIRL